MKEKKSLQGEEISSSERLQRELIRNTPCKATVLVAIRTRRKKIGKKLTTPGFFFRVSSCSGALKEKKKARNTERKEQDRKRKKEEEALGGWKSALGRRPRSLGLLG